MTNKQKLYKARQLRTDKIIFGIEALGVNVLAGVMVIGIRFLSEDFLPKRIASILVVAALVTALGYQIYAAIHLIKKHKEIKELEKEAYIA